MARNLLLLIVQNRRNVRFSLSIPLSWCFDVEFPTSTTLLRGTTAPPVSRILSRMRVIAIGSLHHDTCENIQSFWWNDNCGYPGAGLACPASPTLLCWLCWLADTFTRQLGHEQALKDNVTLEDMGVEKILEQWNKNSWTNLRSSTNQFFVWNRLRCKLRAELPWVNGKIDSFCRFSRCVDRLISFPFIYHHAIGLKPNPIPLGSCPCKWTEADTVSCTAASIFLSECPSNFWWNRLY